MKGRGGLTSQVWLRTAFSCFPVHWSIQKFVIQSIKYLNIQNKKIWQLICVGQSCCFSLWQVGFLGEDETAFQARRSLSKYQIQKYKTLKILNTGVKSFAIVIYQQYRNLHKYWVFLISWEDERAFQAGRHRHSQNLSFKSWCRQPNSTRSSKTFSSFHKQQLSQLEFKHHWCLRTTSWRLISLSISSYLQLLYRNMSKSIDSINQSINQRVLIPSWIEGYPEGERDEERLMPVLLQWSSNSTRAIGQTNPLPKHTTQYRSGGPFALKCATGCKIRLFGHVHCTLLC